MRAPVKWKISLLKHVNHPPYHIKETVGLNNNNKKHAEPHKADFTVQAPKKVLDIVNVCLAYRSQSQTSIWRRFELPSRGISGSEPKGLQH